GARPANGGWVIEWLPIRCPAAAICFAWAGYLSTKVPVRKNVAVIRSRARVVRIEGTAAALAPASKVSATTFSLVGRRSRSRPERAGGKTVGCGLAGLDDGAGEAARLVAGPATFGFGAVTGAGLPQPATVTVAARAAATSAAPVRTGGRYVCCPVRATP